MEPKTEKYLRKSHCKYYLKIHLIIVVKYRKKLLTKNLSSDMKKIIFEISTSSDFTVDLMETDKDHIHLLLDISPKISVSSIVNRIKSISTNHIWKIHKNFLKQHFWKENTFWSDGYFVCSIGEANPDTIRRYIETQG